jgi:predicted RNase H-like HicB family nuclease
MAFPEFEGLAEMILNVEIERESDDRWIGEVLELPGVLAYGASEQEARAKVQALALRVLADRLEHGEAGPDLLSISLAAT